MTNQGLQCPEAVGTLDPHMPASDEPPVWGSYQVEDDRVVVPLGEKSEVFDATALLDGLHRVVSDVSSSGELRITADQIEGRLSRRTDRWTLPDAAGFLQALGVIPAPPVKYEGLSEEQVRHRRLQLGQTLVFAKRRGDEAGVVLVEHYLQLLELK